MANIVETVEPNERDVADIGLAIKSFKGAWGSVSPQGVFKHSSDAKQLWLMFYLENSLLGCLIAEAVPDVYHERYLNSTHKWGVHSAANNCGFRVVLTNATRFNSSLSLY